MSLVAEFTTGGGDVVKFGADEGESEQILRDVSFTSSIPGGWKGAEIQVWPNYSAQELERLLLGRAHIYTDGGKTLYRGEVSNIARDESGGLTISATGLVDRFTWDDRFSFLGIDRDLSKWEVASTARQLALMPVAPANRYPFTPSFEVVRDDTGNPALKLSIDRISTSSLIQDYIEIYYDAQGENIGQFRVEDYHDRNTGGVALNSADFDSRMFLCTDDLGSSSIANANYIGTTGAKNIDNTAGSTRTFAGVWFWVRAIVIQDGHWAIYLKNPAILGDHGLTYTLPTGGTGRAGGYLASDLVKKVVERADIGIEIAPDEIEASTFVVPHFAKFAEGTAADAIEELAGFGAGTRTFADWGIYEDFFWRSPATYGTTWRVRRDEGAVPIDEGPSADDRVNGVVVRFTDGAGTEWTVGPSDASARLTSSLLRDDSPDNVVNAAGISKKYRTIDAGLTTPEGAVLIGQLALAELNARKRRGTIDITTARDEGGSEHHVGEIRAGDRVVVEDDEDLAPRKIVEVTYSSSGDAAACQLDSHAPRLEVLLGRLGSVSTNY